MRDGHLQIPFLHWWWVLIHWVAAVFCFLLCRDLKCGWTASLAGGAVLGTHIGVCGSVITNGNATNVCYSDYLDKILERRQWKRALH